MDLVPEIDLSNALSDRLKGWAVSGKALERTFRFPSFQLAREFVNAVADAAEKADHHPGINFNYVDVTISLTSHDAGGITNRDIRMAGKIDELAPQFMHPSNLRSA